MAYFTLTDLNAGVIPQDVLAYLTDDSDSQTKTVSADVVSAIADLVTAECDRYLAGQYDLPVDPVPDSLRGAAVQMGVYYLYKRRVASAPIPEAVMLSYQAQIDWLRRSVATGDIPLEHATSGTDVPAEAHTGRSPAFRGRERTFTHDGLKGL